MSKWQDGWEMEYFSGAYNMLCSYFFERLAPSELKLVLCHENLLLCICMWDLHSACRLCVFVGTYEIAQQMLNCLWLFKNKRSKNHKSRITSFYLAMWLLIRAGHFRKPKWSQYDCTIGTCKYIISSKETTLIHINCW